MLDLVSCGSLLLRRLSFPRKRETTMSDDTSITVSTSYPHPRSPREPSFSIRSVSLHKQIPIPVATCLLPPRSISPAGRARHNHKCLALLARTGTLVSTRYVAVRQSQSSTVTGTSASNPAIVQRARCHSEPKRGEASQARYVAIGPSQSMAVWGFSWRSALGSRCRRSLLSSGSSLRT